MTDLLPDLTAADDAGPAVEGRAFSLGKKEGHLEAARIRASVPPPSTPARGASPASFTAAARIIQMDSEAERTRVKSGRARNMWQDEAWGYFDALPEIKNGARFKGRSLSKLRLNIGVQLDPGAEPVPVSQLEEMEDQDPCPPAVLAAATDVLDRLSGGKGHDALLDRWGRNSFVAGEAFLIGYQDESSPTGETFYMASPDELRITDRGAWSLVLDPEDKPTDWVPLPADTSIMVRVWNQHARYGNLPDSSVRGVTDLCEILLAERNSELGDAFSRANNGILIMPHSMVGYAPPLDDDAPEAGSAALRNPVIRDIYDHITTPIQNPRSASVAAPYIMTADADDIEKVRYLTFTSDRGSPEKIVQLRQQLAQGVDLPEEILLGFGSATYSNSWIINDQTWTFYLQPDATQFVSALTMGLFRPLLLEGGTDASWVRRLCIWFDKSALVGDPDESTNAFKAVEMGLIGDTAGRHRLGYSEAEAPTEDDIALRIALKRGEQPDLTVAGQAEGVTEDPGAAPAAPAEETAPADPAATASASPLEDGPRAVTAAASPTRLASLARKWAKRDRQLLDRLMSLSDSSVNRALDKAGAKLRTKAVRASAAHAESIQGVPNRDVAAFFGPNVVTASLGMSPDDLIGSSFDELQGRYEDLVARAQKATRRDLQQLGLSDDDCDALEAQQDEDRHRGAALLTAGLVAFTSARLFDPRPNAPALGEFDSALNAPVSVIREALTTAGGGSSGLAHDGAAAGITPGGTSRDPITDRVSTGVTDGASISGMLQALHISTTGWVWNVGEPDHPFEPHQELEGVEFTSWTDEALVNSGSWPEAAFYFPGDHDGCQCYPEQILSAEDDSEG